MANDADPEQATDGSLQLFSKYDPLYEKIYAENTNKPYMAVPGQCQWCPCSCHAKGQTCPGVPAFMQGLVGKMFHRRSGRQVFGKSCDFIGCDGKQMSTATMEYWLPRWFASVNMRVQLKRCASSGPQLQLSMARRIPDTSQAVIFAHDGNIEGLKYLFSCGLASPGDVSESRGFSLMRVSDSS